MNKFYVIANKSRDEDLEKTKAICQFLELRGKKCGYIGIERIFDNDEEMSHIAAKITEDVDAIISLGGDGTLIQIANIASRKDIPILGVNMGNLGYLCEVEKEKVFEALEKLLNDEYEIETRMLLSGSMTVASVQMPSEHVLNDVVIARKGTLGTQSYKVSVNGAHLYTFSGDGVIISTPTGSTGYNFSAGGPIAAPYAECIILTPICPHALNIRPIVLSDSDEVEVELSGESAKPNISAEVSFDGGKAMPMNPGDKVTVRKSYSQSKIIRLGSQTFFETLSRKMKDR